MCGITRKNADADSAAAVRQGEAELRGAGGGQHPEAHHERQGVQGCTVYSSFHRYDLITLRLNETSRRP